MSDLTDLDLLQLACDDLGLPLATASHGAYAVSVYNGHGVVLGDLLSKNRFNPAERIPQLCNAVPALIAEVERLRRRMNEDHIRTSEGCDVFFKKIIQKDS